MNFSVLHISTSDSGGAGLGMMRLHQSLLEIGIDSKVLVFYKESDQSSVIQYAQPRRFKGEKRLMKYGLYRRSYLSIKKEYDKVLNSHNVFYTLPVSQFDVERHPLVKSSDIIHLHWIANFVNFTNFFKECLKPIIWTVRDENPFLGGYHFRNAIISGDRELDNFEKKLVDLKVESISKNRNLTFVSLSESMKKFGKSFLWTNKYEHCVIPNSVNFKNFFPVDKNCAKRIFNLPDDKIILSFVSLFLNDKRKGLTELMTAFEKLNHKSKFHLLIAGKNDNICIPTSENVTYVGEIKDTKLLSIFLSASDYYVNPSFAESFGKTTTEALACGVPVVSFPNYGSLDIINEQNGLITKDFTVEALIEGIEKIQKKTFNQQTIINDLFQRYSPEKIAKDYLTLYNSKLIQ